MRLRERVAKASERRALGEEVTGRRLLGAAPGAGR